MTRLRREWLGCVLAVLAFAALLQYSGAVERLDLGLYDSVLRLNAQPARSDVVIVAIDEVSLAALGRWPWPRRYHAQMLDRLAAAAPRAVALDLMFVEPDPDPAVDAQLARALRALRAHSPVWLPVTAAVPLVDGQPAQALRPLPLLEQAASGLGHIDVELDTDATARSLYLYEGTRAQMWPSLSARLSGETTAGPAVLAGTGSGTGWQRQSQRLIPFSGPAGHYTTVPYAALLRGEVAPQFLRNKLVLVGLTATGIGDQYPTPFSAGQGLVPGTEINAAALDGLLGDRMLTPLPPPWRWAPGMALLMGWMTLMWRLGPRTGLAGLAATIALGLASSVALQVGARLWWPPATWLCAALLGYLLWNWRRLAVLFTELHQRAALLGRAGSGLPPGHDLPDSWQRVVGALDFALDAQRQRDDTLQLLSHDLRAPQSAIRALLRSDAHQLGGAETELHQRIGAQVDATLALAEDFVVQLRAESNAYVWHDAELGQMLHEVRERALPLARAHAITLTLATDSAAADDHSGHWVRADLRLLDRALFNLVENAIKYSPDSTAITLTLDWCGRSPARHAVIALHDQGRGISPADMPRLFERYARFGSPGGATDTGAAPTGHGLGLWFVKMVIERHGGTIVCTSQPGTGTSFVVALPEAPPEAVDGDK